MTNNPFGRQEYLKKYLGGSSAKSKKKKVNPKSRVIDDDIDLKDISSEPAKTDEESEDEAPIIASIIDERPFHVRAKEGYVTTQWKTLGPDDKEIVEETTSRQDFEYANGRKRHDSDSDVSLDQGKKTRHDSSSDLSPPRPSSLNKDAKKKGEISPARNSKFKSRRHNSKEPISLVKKDTGKSKRDLLPPRNRDVLRHDSDSDISPPRKSSKNNDSVSNNRKSSSKRQKNDRNDSDSDLSLPRPSANQDSDNDLSPPRNKTRNIPRSGKRKRRDSNSDISPPRDNKRSTNIARDRSNKKLSLSPELNKHSNDVRRKETLSGLKAGLQDARALRGELESAKKREEEMMKKIGDDISGKGAETVFREKNSGKRRNFKEEKRLQRIENEEKAKFDEKYMEWGKGVKQVEERHNRLGEDLYEMSKPLARYADDEDLEKLLKEQEREGDPMLKFIKKKKEREIDSDKVLPKYKGPPPAPNRFGIPPGYRWDGVDRSNEFEKKVFDRQSNKIAMEEEAYKWSVENM